MEDPRHAMGGGDVLPLPPPRLRHCPYLARSPLIWQRGILMKVAVQSYVNGVIEILCRYFQSARHGHRLIHTYSASLDILELGPGLISLLNQPLDITGITNSVHKELTFNLTSGQNSAFYKHCRHIYHESDKTPTFKLGAGSRKVKWSPTMQSCAHELPLPVSHLVCVCCLTMSQLSR